MPTLHELSAMRPRPAISVLVDIDGRAQAGIEGGEWITGTRTGAPREFRSIDSAAAALRRAGIREFRVLVPQALERVPA